MGAEQQKQQRRQRHAHLAGRRSDAAPPDTAAAAAAKLACMRRSRGVEGEAKRSTAGMNPSWQQASSAAGSLPDRASSRASAASKTWGRRAEEEVGGWVAGKQGGGHLPQMNSSDTAHSRMFRLPPVLAVQAVSQSDQPAGRRPQPTLSLGLSSSSRNAEAPSAARKAVRSCTQSGEAGMQLTANRQQRHHPTAATNRRQHAAGRGPGGQEGWHLWVAGQGPQQCAGRGRGCCLLNEAALPGCGGDDAHARHLALDLQYKAVHSKTGGAVHDVKSCQLLAMPGVSQQRVPRGSRC